MGLTKLKSIAKPSFSTSAAAKLGVSARMLAYYAERGQLVRLSHGFYCFPGEQDLSLQGVLRERLAAIPQAVIGMRTALRLYGLSEEISSKIDLIVPDTRFPKRRIPDVRLHRVKDHLVDISIVKREGIKVTSLERTIVDLLRSGEPLSFVLGVYAEAHQKRVQIQLPLIRKLATTFRAKKKTEQFLEAVL